MNTKTKKGKKWQKFTRPRPEQSISIMGVVKAIIMR